MTAFEVHGLEFGYGEESLFREFDLSIETGEFFGVIGPNGAGKSTLLRLLAGLLRPRKGTVMMLGHDLAAMPRRDVARSLGVVLQESHFTFDYTVAEVVMMGRNPHLGRFEQPGPADRKRVAGALEFVDASGLAGKLITEISSGERQRVVLARALAQEPDVLLLDEATSHLDISHQLSISRILRRLNDQGRTVVLLSHDLNLAALCCSRLLLLDRGEAVACGEPDRVLSADLVRQVYGIEPVFVVHPTTGRRQLMPGV